MSHVTWIKFLEARERNGEWAGPQKRSWVSCVVDGVSCCDISQNLSTLSHPGNLEVPSSMFRRMNLTRFAFYCSSAVVSSQTLQSLPCLSHTLGTDSVVMIRVGRNELLSALGISVLSFSIKIHGRRTKITRGFLGGYLSICFFFFWARKKREMFRHFILILIPYLVSYPVETMILPHIYKMSLLIIQSLGSASADSTNIRWKIVGKTILESSRRQSLDLRGFGL